MIGTIPENAIIAKQAKVGMIWVARHSPTLVSQNLKATTLTYLAIVSWIEASHLGNWWKKCVKEIHCLLCGLEIQSICQLKDTKSLDYSKGSAWLTHGNWGATVSHNPSKDCNMKLQLDNPNIRVVQFFSSEENTEYRLATNVTSIQSFE